MKKILLFLSFLLMSIGVFSETITITYNDVPGTSYSASEQTFTNIVQFGYINIMRNGSNGTPTGWAKEQVLQVKKSGGPGILYNKAAISTIQNIRVYVVSNTNPFTLTYGTTSTCSDGSISRPTTATGIEDITYTAYETGGKTTPGTSGTATYYDFNLNSIKPTYFKITNGSSALYIWKIVITYSTSPFPVIKDTVWFLNCNTLYQQRTDIKKDSVITDFPVDIEPSNECKKNRWEFVGWTKTKNGADTIKSLKVTKNDTLYALYKLKNTDRSYITDTLTFNDFSATKDQYTDFNNVIKKSGVVYKGNSSMKSNSIKLNSNTHGSPSRHSGIISSISSSQLYNIYVSWKDTAANDEKVLSVYTSNDNFIDVDSLWQGAKQHSDINRNMNFLSLDRKTYIGIRSKEHEIFLDSILITWETLDGVLLYSTTPKCFDTNISVAEWFKDSVKFDIGNYDSIHTYSGPMNSCDSIRITLVNGNKEECIRWFHVPIFAGENTVVDNSDCDVVVLKDSTLTIKNNIANNNVFIYPDGVLHIKDNKMYTVNSLTLRRDNNDVPQFLYEGTLKTNNGMFFELRSDGSDWRWLTLPDSIRINEISEKSEVLLKYYDGNERAKNGRGGWKFLDKDSISGFGTIFGVNIDTDEKRIYKFRLDTNILSQEKNAHKYIKVGKFNSSKPNDRGWNLVGNPFMTTYNVNTLFGVIFESDSLVKEIIDGQWTGRWVTEEKDLRYIVIPSDKQEQHIIDAGGYEQICLRDGYRLKPFTSFFIQAKDGGDLIFYHGQRVANAPSRMKTNENKESFLRICVGPIKTGCYISNKFDGSYEIGDDMESLYSTYQLINGNKLLYSAINDSIINNGIEVYTSGGLLSLDDKTDVNDFQEINVLYDGQWFDLLGGQTLEVNNVFILQARRKTNDVTTDNTNINDEIRTIKFIGDDGNIYILKNNCIFTILGNKIK